MEMVLEGKALLPDGVHDRCIGIEDGKIAAIKGQLKGDRHVRVREGLILPAGIDIHVHFRDPGLTRKEDFSTGTASAAFGGISCIFDMPNTKPQAVTKKALDEKRKKVSKKSYVDFGLYGGLSQDTNVEAMAKRCNAFKLYMATTTGKMLLHEEVILLNVLEHVRRTGRVVAVHAEDEHTIQANIKKDTSLRGHRSARPDHAETLAVTRLHKLTTSTHIHICHISVGETLPVIKAAGYSCEVAPHHLFLDDTMSLDTWGKVNPPLRSKRNQANLWHGLETGDIPILASDHAPHTRKDKEKPFEEAACGIPGVETMYPLMLARVAEKKFKLSRLVDAISVRPAWLMGLNKGQIKLGMDADLMVCDLRKLTKIRGERLHSKAGWSPYDGMSAVFPEMTLVRGHVVVEGRELVGKRGWGQQVSV